MRIVFMGTPPFAVETLDAICKAGFEVVGVVTAVDKPAGRGLTLQPSAVKQYATNHSIPVLQPEKLKDEVFLAELKALNADLQVVVAFRMLPEVVWNMPPKGTLNLHASLLPQYRGAAPINWAIVNGESETGVTTFFIEHQIDTGNIILQDKVAIDPLDNAGTLHDKLAATGSRLVVETLHRIQQGTAPKVPQSELLAPETIIKTAPKIFKPVCQINWNQSVESVHNLVRGMSPYPAAWSLITDDQKQLSAKIFETEMVEVSHNQTPGTIETDGKKELLVATQNGYIRIKSIQLEGKKRLSVEEFLRGMPQIASFTFISPK